MSRFTQRQFSWRQAHVKPTHWISSRVPTRLGISLGLHFLESCQELCGPCLYQRARSRKYKQTTVSWQRQRYLLPVHHRFHQATSITDSLSLTRNHAGCWRYSLCYESACDLVIGLFHCNDHQYYYMNNSSHNLIRYNSIKGIDKSLTM